MCLHPAPHHLVLDLEHAILSVCAMLATLLFVCVCVGMLAHCFALFVCEVGLL